MFYPFKLSQNNNFFQTKTHNFGLNAVITYFNGLMVEKYHDKIAFVL
jgi:hypothetical protein